MLITLAVALVLTQAEPAAAPAGDAPAPAADAPPAKPLIPKPDTDTPKAGDALPPGALGAQGPNSRPPPSPDFNLNPPRRQVNIEEVNRQLERIKNLPASEMSDALEQLRKNVPSPSMGPDDKAPPPPEQSPASTYWGLSEPEQVKYEARIFFNDVIAGDARGIVLQSGYPFFLEDRRLELPDELHDEWLKNLRAKRTDLITLYDIEVLTPAEMEKKYGKPPPRLANLPWKQGKTYLAVGNLSGHAAVAVYRQAPSGRGWQLVGYTD